MVTGDLMITIKKQVLVVPTGEEQRGPQSKKGSDETRGV